MKNFDIEVGSIWDDPSLLKLSVDPILEQSLDIIVHQAHEGDPALETEFEYDDFIAKYTFKETPKVYYPYRTDENMIAEEYALAEDSQQPLVIRCTSSCCCYSEGEIFENWQGDLEVFADANFDNQIASAWNTHGTLTFPVKCEAWSRGLAGTSVDWTVYIRNSRHTHITTEVTGQCIYDECSNQVARYQTLEEVYGANDAPLDDDQFIVRLD